jgi:hypothetical protein
LQNLQFFSAQAVTEAPAPLLPALPSRRDHRLAPHLSPALHRRAFYPSTVSWSSVRSDSSSRGMATTSALGRLQADRSALFLCDVQERFRPVISNMPAVIDTAARMVSPRLTLLFSTATFSLLFYNPLVVLSTEGERVT